MLRKKIHKIDVIFESCNKISDAGLKQIKENLGRFDLLKDVSFDFSWCKEVTDVGYDSLIETLQQFASLERVSFSMRGSDKD